LSRRRRRVATCHLLTHTAGWVGDYFSDTGRVDDALARYVAEMVDLEQLTPPGAAVYSYCNSGFCLLGRLIEVLTGETFEAALRRLVLAPLGLEHSFLFPEEVMTRRNAAGHVGVTQLPTPVVPVADDVLDGCVGVYATPLEDVQLGRLGEALVARAISKGGFPKRDTPPPPDTVAPLIRFGFYAEDRLVGLDPPFLQTRAELLRGPDGALAWHRFGGRIHRRILQG
jgi:CubicO group peptidase (beta-lactamase class C family)